jgi:hypothetical protein
MKNNRLHYLFKRSPRQSVKLSSYFDSYSSLFQSYINKPITFVEVGIYGGGSLYIWKKFFHPKSRIIGIDLNPESKKYEKYGYEIHIGDQENPSFWKKFYKKVGKVDIILDDGGHTDAQQTQTLISSIKNINKDGKIVIEDTHASYLTEFGNPSKTSFVNYSKKIIDIINYRFKNKEFLKYNRNKNILFKLFQENIFSISYFESIVSFSINSDKCKMSQIIMNKKLKKIKDYRYENDRESKWISILKLSKFIPNILYKNQFIKNFGKYFARKLIENNKNQTLKKFDF